MSKARPSRMKILADRHQRLDDEVDRMSLWRHLSPTESIQLKELKVMRLRCKDAISKLHKEMTAK